MVYAQKVVTEVVTQQALDEFDEPGGAEQPQLVAP